jgi:hypothetical protein
MAAKWFNASALTLGLCLCSSHAAPSLAMEDTTPFMPGISITSPAGALPPPGFVLSTAVVYFDMTVRNQNGAPTGAAIHDFNEVNQLLWVPKIPEILGATYGAFIVEPLRDVGVSTPGGTFVSSGAVNTVISPLNLSWNLHNGFFVSAGLTLYPADGTYKVANPVNVSRNYFTAEPGFAVSYLADDWNVTLHLVFDINSPNLANGYRSGDVLVADYTALRKFGAFEFGLGGTLTQQLTNDTIHGVTVAAIPGVNGYGNRAAQLDIGPAATYDFGSAKLRAYYVHDIYAFNNPGGDRFYLWLDVRLATDASAKPDKIIAKY